MKQIGIVGLGDMGTGLAKNILKHGFPLTGYDLRQQQLAAFSQLGGKVAGSSREVAERSEAVFVMVLNGQQTEEVILGEQGLLAGLRPGATILVSATIHPSEMRKLEQPVTAKGVALVDTPVSGGRFRADAGTLTVMTAAKRDVFERCKPLLEAIGEHIYHVGEEIGLGQTVKAAHQAFGGACYAGMFEALVLGVKAGVKAETLYEVLSTGNHGSPGFKNAAKCILDRRFKGTGSQITTMYKDLGITMALAQEKGVPMFATSTAYQLFRAGMTMFPDEDNWSVVKVLEQITGVEVKRSEETSG